MMLAAELMLLSNLKNLRCQGTVSAFEDCRAATVLQLKWSPITFLSSLALYILKKMLADNVLFLFLFRGKGPYFAFFHV